MPWILPLPWQIAVWKNFLAYFYRWYAAPCRTYKVIGCAAYRDTPASIDARRVSSNALSLMNRARKLWRSPERIFGIVGGCWPNASRQYATSINNKRTTCCCVDSVQLMKAVVGLWWQTCMNTVHFFHALSYVLWVDCLTEFVIKCRAAFIRSARSVSCGSI